MINLEDLRNYHSSAVIHVLQAEPGSTASELHEAITTMALAAGHPAECSAISPASVAGLLRTLVREGLVGQGEERKNPRYGRAEPTWAVTAHVPSTEFPSAPAGRRSGAGRGAFAVGDPMAGLSREQLLATLLVGDELSAATARFQAEVEEIKNRARRVLASGVLP